MVTTPACELCDHAADGSARRLAAGDRSAQLAARRRRSQCRFAVPGHAVEPAWLLPFAMLSITTESCATHRIDETPVSSAPALGDRAGGDTSRRRLPPSCAPGSSQPGCGFAAPRFQPSSRRRVDSSNRGSSAISNIRGADRDSAASPPLPDAARTVHECSTSDFFARNALLTTSSAIVRCTLQVSSSPSRFYDDR